MDEKQPHKEKEPELSTKTWQSYGGGLLGENAVDVNRQDGLVKINLGGSLSHAGENAKYRLEQVANKQVQQHALSLSETRPSDSGCVSLQNKD